MSKDTENSLKRIAKSLEEVVSLLKGDRQGVLTEPAQIDLRTLQNIADAVSENVLSEGKELD